MSIETPKMSKFEDIVFKTVNGIHVIAAVHSTKLGPALGGCRLKKYFTFEEQLTDTLRLAQGMSFKNAFAQIPHGGGKMTVDLPDGVDVGDERVIDAIAETVNALHGKYYTAKDVGFTHELIDVLKRRTKYVMGYYSGDPSYMTAVGVLRGIEVALERKEITNPSFAIEGLGGVGFNLLELLHRKYPESKIYVYDINRSAYDRRVDVSVKEIMSAEPNKVWFVKDIATVSEHIREEDVDVYVPCAVGACIDENWRKIKASIIAGSANNQLLNREVGQEIFEAGKLYAPDFVINAGGVIHVAQEFKTKNKEKMDAFAEKQCNAIGESLKQIFEQSWREGIPTNEIAVMLAKERLK